MKKILVAIIISVFAVSTGFLGVHNVYAAEISTEAECKEHGGSWVVNNNGHSCVADWIDTGEACTAAKGLWQMKYEVGNYNNFICVLRVDDDGELVTSPKPSHTYSNAECNVLPDAICGAKDNKDLEGSAIWQIVLFIIEILTMGVGLLALAGIVYGSVLYSSAGGNPEQVKKARTTIVNVVIGVVAYALMYALLQWIVPGGVF